MLQNEVTGNFGVCVGNRKLEFIQCKKFSNVLNLNFSMQKEMQHFSVNIV